MPRVRPRGADVPAVLASPLLLPCRSPLPAVRQHRGGVGRQERQQPSRGPLGAQAGLSLSLALPVSCSRSRWGPSSGCWATTTCKAILPIRSDVQLDEAIAVLNGLLARGRPLDDREQGYLEALGNEIERYEAEAVPRPEVSGADMLRHLTGRLVS